MKLRTIIVCLVAIAFGSASQAATMDFDSLPLGTVFGNSVGHTPNQVVLTNDGIEMSVEDFVYGSFVGFFEAEIGGRYHSFFPTPSLALNNINVQFDFTKVQPDVDLVTIEYMAFGGTNNFAVNGGTILELADLSAIPVAVAPGVTATVVANVITLSGDVDYVKIGGQELAIDTIVAIPEPLTATLLGIGCALALRRRRKPTV